VYEVHQGGTTWILDIGVVCPGTQRYVDRGSQTTPGRAAEACAAIKATKHADKPNFVLFTVEAGGYINRRSHLFLDTVPRCPAPPDRHPKTSRSQDIVVAIPAVDLAVEAVA
jgi:hypothetical protein